MDKRLAWILTIVFGLVMALASCAGLETKPTAADFKAPIVKLVLLEVPQYDGYWYYCSTGSQSALTDSRASSRCRHRRSCSSAVPRAAAAATSSPPRSRASRSSAASKSGQSRRGPCPH